MPETSQNWTLDVISTTIELGVFVPGQLSLFRKNSILAPAGLREHRTEPLMSSLGYILNTST
jgi:hypothetical protein